MNKKITEFFESCGMTVNKNFAYGRMNGYETNAVLKNFDFSFPLVFHISFYATDEQKRNMEFAIRNLALKFFSMSFTRFGLTLGFNDMTFGRLVKRLPETLDKIFAIISQNGGLGAEFCPVCGRRFGNEEVFAEEGLFADNASSAPEQNALSDENAEEKSPSAEANAETEQTPIERTVTAVEPKQCNIDGFTITIDRDCVDTINSIISQENKDFDNAPKNYFKGFLGAFIGGLAGVVVAIVLYLVNFISSLSAVISIALGTFLYRKFRGKPDKMMIVIVSVTTLVMMIASVVGIYIVAAGIAAHEVGVPLSAIEAFGVLMEDAEFARLFYSDLGLVVLFSLMGIGIEIAVLAKSIKRKKHIS